MLDFLIINASVCSGLQEPARRAAVGIVGDRIVRFEAGADRPPAQRVIDGTGMILAPGFIDPHASTGLGYFFPNAADHKLYQGITTEIFGNCGTSAAPIGPHLEASMRQQADAIGFRCDWKTTAEYFERIAGRLPFNIGMLVGHSTLRHGHMDSWKALKPGQLQTMQSALRQALDEGALGFSTGLIYAPGCFAELDELVALARIAGERGGIYASHIRDERNHLEAAVEEALIISERTGTRTLISHLKAAERQNWGKVPKVLQRIEQFNALHPQMPAAIDVYPYTAISTKLRAFIPKQHLQDGIHKLAQRLRAPAAVQDIARYIAERNYDLASMLITSDEHPEYAGKTVAAIAREQGTTPAQAIADILIKGSETWIVYHCISQDDVDAAVLWPHSMICTDSWSYPINAPKTIGHPHPRSFGAFTEYLHRYVLELKALSWESAVHKITQLPAQLFQLHNRGRIADGCFADLVLLNPNRLQAHATYTSPRRLSSGVEYLWVNGRLMIDAREIRRETPGRVLKPTADAA